MTYEIQITSDLDGVKPKNFLKKTLDLPFFMVVKHIKDKRITLNGKKIKKDSILREGDIIKVWLDSIQMRQEEKREIRAQNLNIPKIFENEDFILLNKLSGIVVQGSQDSNESLSLHLEYLKQQNNDNSDFQYMHVHRIDKDTSGAILIAKNQPTSRTLNELFRRRDIQKKYYALVIGVPLEEKGEIEVNLTRNPEGQREKVSVTTNPDVESKTTLSRYKVVEIYEHNQEEYALVEVEIKTGFMHQIRVHMKHLGHPLVGDKMYGNSLVNKEFEENFELNRQFLHAKSVKFEFKKEKYEFKADLQEDLQKTLKGMKKID